MPSNTDGPAVWRQSPYSLHCYYFRFTLRTRTWATMEILSMSSPGVTGTPPSLST